MYHTIVFHATGTLLLAVLVYLSQSEVSLDCVRLRPSQALFVFELGRD